MEKLNTSYFLVVYDSINVIQLLLVRLDTTSEQL